MMIVLNNYFSFWCSYHQFLDVNSLKVERSIDG